ncbi:hypothetical protein [Thalassotalea sp. G2M2-11]|uniref:hypothetical protein n=1 Tax=Thalassotalea sp. G2M2-11 TaxID=2787627 RepID=UPI0019D078B8|nr:hypothetical protein [Thalassotalea sp. G2M2-11]
MMSMLRSHELVKGKIIKGTGSILANLDAKTRKAYAKCANKVMEHKIKQEKELAFQEELKDIHQQQKNQKRDIRNKHHHSLTYWLVKASFAEIWHCLFSKENKG